LSAIAIFAGPVAREQIRSRGGLQPADISTVIGAAGGPKGLALLPLDNWVFGDWLSTAKPNHVTARQVIGASIGAWRMAAGSTNNPKRYLNQLQEAYLERQRYPIKPASALVANICRQVVQDLIGSPAQFLADQHPDYCLQAITAFSQQRTDYRPVFLKAALLNTLSRQLLRKTLSRQVWHSPNQIPAQVFDDHFDLQHHDFNLANLEDALLASGTIPLLADPVLNIAGGPTGAYWDGGLTDYHLYLPLNRLPGLVLYPHFSSVVTAGWLDKSLPWRRHGVGKAGQHWLDNVVLVAPSKTLLASLPAQKIPDRNDFYQFGTRHDERIAQWRATIDRCQAIATDFDQFVQHPSRFDIQPLP
jgi:hypothetical protein